MLRMGSKTFPYSPMKFIAAASLLLAFAAPLESQQAMKPENAEQATKEFIATYMKASPEQKATAFAALTMEVSALQVDLQKVKSSLQDVQSRTERQRTDAQRIKSDFQAASLGCRQDNLTALAAVAANGSDKGQSALTAADANLSCTNRLAGIIEKMNEALNEP